MQRVAAVRLKVALVLCVKMRLGLAQSQAPQVLMSDRGKKCSIGFSPSLIITNAEIDENQIVFFSLDQARSIIAAWVEDYNTTRGHARHWPI